MRLVLYLTLVLLVVLVFLCIPCSALSRHDIEVEGLIRHYWKRHKKYAVILAYLRLVHGVSASMTWLKKKLQEMGLFRRGVKVNYTPVSILKAAIQAEIDGPNCNVGYRQMWQIIQNKYGYVTKRSTVMMVMKILNPDGVERRRRNRLKRRVYQNKGPNYVWHLDGYDKLKPYGFAIHGCIDGYSRKMIWLKLTSTNNNPRVILLYYLLHVLFCQGVPTLVRSDCGTENSSLATCQMLLRHDHNDQFKGEKSFRYGSSTTNTRIESWWAQLRKSLTDYWINTFKDMIGMGEFNPTLSEHKHCLGYVYGTLIEKTLCEFQERWNSHTIRQNRLAGCPSGVPDDLYNLPEMNGTEDYKKTLNMDAWLYCYTTKCCKPPPLYPKEFDVAATSILNHDLHMEKRDITADHAKLVYLHLLSKFTSD